MRPPGYPEFDDLISSPRWRSRTVHVRREPARPARHAAPDPALSPRISAFLEALGAGRLWTHQAKALRLAREGRDVLLTTGPASGKSLGYLLPLMERLEEDPAATALCLFPTKALARDQLRRFASALESLGLRAGAAGVFDGDSPAAARRRLRERGSVVLSNPDALHAAILPQHGRWSRFFSRLSLVVLDEIHAYSGMFGTNVAWLLRRLFRVCLHHGSRPRVVACSATIGNPEELARELTGREFELIDDDGSPRGPRTFLFWNPPRVRESRRRSRRSANVEATEVYADLVRRGVKTIVFSKARVTAELIHRYAEEKLGGSRISVYRGGLLPEERREIEEALFSGELRGVSTTNALELGIDVGGLDAAIVVGYPGRLASLFQQAGRAGRNGAPSLAILVGLDTATNQYVLRHPEHVFGRPVEDGVIDRVNPYVLLGHLRCAAHELPVAEPEVEEFGESAPPVLEVLEENRKLRRIDGRWFHAASEAPQHEVSLRDATDRNVVVLDADSREAIGEVSRFDAPAVVHPGAVHLKHGATWLVSSLDVERSVAFARRTAVDYYTQSLGADDVHHVDHRLREKPFGAGRAFHGEVTAHYRVFAYERIRFYTLDAISRHPLDLPTYPVDTSAFWIVPPESDLAEIRRSGLDPMSGLKGIGFALRSHLPLFFTCEALDLSHSVGALNAPWQAVFVWEHYARGLGFTARAFEILGRLVTAARDTIAACDCGDGCPLCVGKPLHPYTVLNPERGEGSIPSRHAALAILDRLLSDGSRLDLPGEGVLTDTPESRRNRLLRALRRRLERMAEPDVMRPAPVPVPGWPEPAPEEDHHTPDPLNRRQKRRDFHRRMSARLSKGRSDHGTG